MTDFDQETYAALRAFLPSFIATDPFRRFGCNRVGIGRRHRGGVQTDEICLRIYLAYKLPLDQIPAERRVPPSVRVVTPESQRTVDVATDVIDLTVLEIGPAIYAIEAAAEGMAVQKYGQTTELTHGGSAPSPVPSVVTDLDCPAPGSVSIRLWWRRRSVR